MSKGTRTLVVLAIAVAAAGLASFGVYRAVQQIPVREVEVASVEVVVASRSMPTGSLLTPSDVKLVPWPSRNQVPGAIVSLEQVTNRGLIASVVENEPITEMKLAPIEAGAGLPPSIPAGMRAISVRVNEVIGVAGFVVPGTYVDVVVTIPRQEESMSRVVVSNVQVLTAGTRYDQEQSRDGEPIQTTVVTLLVTPPDAERIALASSEGQVMLTLRNPLDTAPTETNGTRMASLMGTPDPPPARPVARRAAPVVRVEPPPPPRIYTVEAIRAAERTTEEVVP